MVSVVELELLVELVVVTPSAAGIAASAAAPAPRPGERRRADLRQLQRDRTAPGRRPDAVQDQAGGDAIAAVGIRDQLAQHVLGLAFRDLVEQQIYPVATSARPGGDGGGASPGNLRRRWPFFQSS
ncbi:MAG: hypothetical protein WCP68_11765 [Enhydrobacter sp.]